MKCFFRLTSISLQSHLYYRTSFLLNLLTPIVLLFGQYMLWGGGAVWTAGRDDRIHDAERDVYLYSDRICPQ